MNLLISAQELEKSFGSRSLFKGLCFGVEEGDRIGLIGPNGAGKSTLLKMLAGQIEADLGRCTSKKGLRVAYLDQVSQFDRDALLMPTLMAAVEDPFDWQNMARAQELLARAELDQFGEDALVSSLSGGWKKRLAIVRELMREPELLLLDEPTNHLDVEGILWLESLIKSSPMATITITHDRVFLQRVSNRIIELNPRFVGGLLSIKGSYLDFLEGKEATFQALASQETKLRNTLRRETEWLRRGAQARQTKQKARIQSAGNLSEQVDELGQVNQERTLRVQFQSFDRQPKKLVEVKKIAKSYGADPVVPRFDLLMSPKSRIGLLGPNGCGKSTLIKLILKQIDPDEGEIFHAEQLRVASFEQNRDSLDLQKTLWQTLCSEGDHVEFQGTFVHVRSYLSRFLFRSEQMDMKVERLSGGEQSRLLIAKLMLQPANLLVLDEPTNDLDLETLDVLSEILTDFNGAVLLVTHDRYFLDQVSDQIVAFGIDSKGQKTIEKMVGLEQWEAWHLDQLKLREKLMRENPELILQKMPSLALEEKQTTSNLVRSNNQPSQKQAALKKLSYKDQRELENIEENIQRAELKLSQIQKEIDQISTKPQADRSAFSELSKALADAQEAIDKLYRRWEELS